MSTSSPTLVADDIEARKARARTYFEDFRDRLCAALEAIENEARPPLYEGPAGRFERTHWQRGDGSEDCGGGVASILRGRVIEKAGVHVSTVYGEFNPDFAAQVKGAAEDPRFWASGVSVIIHQRNPRVPAAHMNVRMINTTRTWFGGGGDLTPTLAPARRDDHPDAIAFHAAMKQACDAHDPSYYPHYKDWCDRYFFLPHRNEPRGVGGIFIDDLATGDWEDDFSFIQKVAEAFLTSYTAIVRERMCESWSEAERAEQLVCRGRYVEFNLLYDRGTAFGLKTGGNVESILSSMPPVVTWP